jgi:hypothetical protein
MYLGNQTGSVGADTEVEGKERKVSRMTFMFPVYSGRVAVLTGTLKVENWRMSSSNVVEIGLSYSVSILWESIISLLVYLLPPLYIGGLWTPVWKWHRIEEMPQTPTTPTPSFSIEMKRSVLKAP